MQTFVTLWKYTRDGLMDMKNTSDRYEVVKKIISDAGGKLKAIYALNFSRIFRIFPASNRKVETRLKPRIATIYPISTCV